MKHFETLYEDSEKLFANIDADKKLDDVVIKIIKELECIRLTSDKMKQAECLGRVLYYISGISQKQSINIYAALNETLEDLKLEAYDSGQNE